MRRHLSYSPAEVDAMPWWELQMWTEGLVREFADEDDEEGDARTGPDEAPGEAASLDDLAGLGVAVRSVG